MSPTGESLSDELLAVRVIPRAGRDEIAGVRDGKLLVRTAAPPEGGRANAVVLALIAQRLRLARKDVVLARGERSREKLLRLNGMTAAAALERLLG